MKDIEKLIPHRSPFLFLDEITSVEADKITGNMTFDKSLHSLTSNLPDSSFVPGTIIIESMVQCGGAGIKLLGLTDGLFGLANIENANFHQHVKFGDKIHYEIKNIRVGKKVVKQSGTAYINEVLVLDASWMCARID